MIPKIIHYCWFGGADMPEKLQKCMESWKRQLPGYTIMRWDEQSFDVNAYSYTRQAYACRKYAFVSNVARIKALQEYGGIYMDTDVEVFKPFDSVLEHRCVLGFEYRNWVATSFIACEKGHSILRLFEQEYEGASFETADGGMNMVTNVERLTALLEKQGLVRDNTFQLLPDGIAIYPKEYFSPYDYGNCVMEKTENSICAHHFYATWLPWKTQMKKTIKRVITAGIGKKNLVALRNKLRGQNEQE